MASSKMSGTAKVLRSLSIAGVLIYFLILLCLTCYPHVQRFSSFEWFDTAIPKEIEWIHPVCGCPRFFQTRSPFASDGQHRSMCGPASDVRGPHQRVISFAFYGDVTSDYFLGIARNAELVPLKYPGWVMRLYHDLSPTNETTRKLLCDRICPYPYVDDCYVEDLSSRVGHDMRTKFGMLWRFAPLADPLVDIFTVRDVDSTIYQREVDAVNEWLSSDKIWHVMRDYPSHIQSILGGGWGVKMNSADFAMTTTILNKMLSHKGKKKYGYDEWLLDKYAYPEASKSLYAHDSYNCKKYPYSHPFPTQRVNRTFVIGRIRRNLTNIIRRECPYECRPANHKDWLYC